MKDLMGLETAYNSGEFTLDIVRNVFVFSSVVVLLGYLLNRKLSSSSIQKTVWQTGILTILVFVAITVTGQGNALSQYLSAQWNDSPTQPLVEATPFESDSSLQDFVPADRDIFDDRLADLGWDDLEGEELETVELVPGSVVELQDEQPPVELRDEDQSRSADAAVIPPSSQPEQNRWLEKVSFVFFSVWGIGTIVFLTRLLVGRLLLALYCRRLKVSNDSAIAPSVAQIARILGHRGSIRILESKHSATPLALGMFRPTLILPTRMIAELDSRQRDVMLAHEIAHLSSYDPAWTIAMDVLLAVLWWHPAVWYLKKQLNHVNEHYADDASLIIEGGPTSLAECLVDLGARLLQEKKVEWINLEGIPMAGRNSGNRNFHSSLGQRVARLLSLNDRNRQQFARPMRNSMKVCGSLLIVASVIVGQTWANPGSFYKGESTVSLFKNNWRKSLAGVAILAFIGSPNSNADDKKDDAKEKKIVLELKEAKPVQIRIDKKKGNLKIIELAGKKVDEVQKVHKGHVVIETLSDGTHEMIELSGSSDEIKKKMAIHLKKLSVELLKVAKSGDKKKVVVLKKKLEALKKALSGIRLEGGKGKARFLVKGRDDKKATAIRQRIVIGDGEGKGKVRVLAPLKLQDRVRVILDDRLDKGKLKLLIENTKSVDKVRLKTLIEFAENTQKSARSKTRRSSSGTGRTSQRVRASRSDASRLMGRDIEKLHAKISHLKKAAESLKAAGLKEKAKELLVTAEKLAAEAKERAAKLDRQRAEFQKQRAEQERAIAEARKRGERQRDAADRRDRSTQRRAASRSRSSREGIATGRRGSEANANAELIKVIRELSREMKELRKEVNALKKKVNK